MVVISDCVKDAKEAIKAYREKDVVEKGVLRLKSSLDLGRLRVHSETGMQNADSERCSHIVSGN